MSLGNIFPDKYFPTKMFTLPQLQLEKLLDAGLKLKQGREKGEKEEKASFDPRKPWLLSNILPHGQQPASTSCSPACGRRKQLSNLSQGNTSEQDTQFQVQGPNRAFEIPDLAWIQVFQLWNFRTQSACSTLWRRIFQGRFCRMRPRWLENVLCIRMWLRSQQERKFQKGPRGESRNSANSLFPTNWRL